VTSLISPDQPGAQTAYSFRSVSMILWTYSMSI